MTKNGYGSMVVMSIDTYSRMMQSADDALDEAEAYAKSNDKRMTHDEVFGGLRKKVNG